MRNRLIPLVVALALAPAAALAQDGGPSEAERALVARIASAEGAEKGALSAELGALCEGESRWSEAAGAWRQARRLRGSLADHEGEARSVLAFAEEVAASGETGGTVSAAFEDARLALSRAREKGSRSPAVALGIARCCDVLGEAEAAIAELRGAHDAFPDDAGVARALGAALVRSGDAPAALDLLRKLSDARPADGALAMDWFAAAQGVGDEAACLAALRRAVKAAPDEIAPWSAVWQMFAPKQRWGELADAAGALAAEAPGGAWSARYAGIACSMARRFDDALGWLDKAWERRRNDSVARSEAARILMTEKKDRDTAIRYYGEAIRVDPSNARANEGIFFLAKRYTDEGNPKASVPLFEILANARRTDPFALNNYANSLRFAGRYDESERTYLAAIERFPNEAQIRNDYALLLDVAGRADDAIRVLKGAHEVDPKNNDSMENLGFLARQRGQRDEALSWFRMARLALAARGEDDHKHRINVDDQRWPLPPLR